MPVGQQHGIDAVRKYPLRPQRRYAFVPTSNVGHATPQHNDIRIENIDHVGQRAGQPIFVALQARQAAGLAVLGRGLPNGTGLIVAALVGIVAGVIAERTMP